MAEVRLAGNLIETLGFFGFNFGHLQIVFVDGGTQLENEVQAPNFLTIPFGGNWQYPPIRDHTSEANTSNFGVDGEYASTTLNLGDRTAESVWDILTQVRAQFVVNGANIDYDVDKNSNSYATTLLSVIGIDVNDVLAGATPADVDQFPGLGVNVLDINGDAFSLNLVGSDENDIFRTGIRDDLIKGGAGNDIINGNDGNDTSIYTGAFENYKLEFLPDQTVRVTDSDSTRDGTDTLTNMEVAQFSDLSINLGPGQDLAFVIDTTGSMFDDIAAVKSQASSIINAIFDPERDLLNSRIAVVGYNDPFTETILSFTNQPNPEDRKSASLNAINSINVFGGGDFPELTYSGLLRALDGRAGQWREEAASRKIILFGDATAKDSSLASQVFALAANLNVNISASFSTFAISDEISLTTFESIEVNEETGIETIVPVQIFTIAIGANPVTQSEFQEIADATGGTAFSAANASEIVDALLDVINLPIYTIKAELSSIEEGDSGTKIVNFTISRDVADSAAVVEIGQSGTADIDDVSGIPSFVSFAEGETEKTIAVSVIGDTAFEIDETLALRITSVDQPATFGGTAATLTIQNDDNEVPNVVLGTESRDNLAGTDGDDEIRSLAGTYDKMSGRLGADVFVFGSEALNGARERDVILDYEPGVDSIRLEDGATVASIRETSNSVVVFLEGDGDAIYVRGTDVAASSLTIFNEDSLFV